MWVTILFQCIYVNLPVALLLQVKSEDVQFSSVVMIIVDVMIILTIIGESCDSWQGSRLIIFDLREADPGLMTATQAASSLDAYSFYQQSWRCFKASRT